MERIPAWAEFGKGITGRPSKEPCHHPSEIVTFSSFLVAIEGNRYKEDEASTPAKTSLNDQEYGHYCGARLADHNSISGLHVCSRLVKAE